MENQNNNGLYREDIDRFENQLQQLRDMMVRQNSLLDDIKSKDNDLSVIQMKIESIEKKSENIEKKIPPLPTILAAGAIIIGILGVSYSDLNKLRQPIQQASQEVHAVSAEVKKSADDLVDSSSSFKKRMDTIQNEQLDYIKKQKDEFMQYIIGQQGMISDVAEALKKIQGVDDKIKRFEGDLSRLVAIITNINSKLAHTEEGILGNEEPISSNEEDLSLVFQSLGDDMPPALSLYFRAQQLYKAKDYDKALSLAIRAKDVDTDSKDSNYDNLIGRCYQKKEMFEEALGAYNEGLSRNPKDDSIWHNLGTLYYMMSEKVEDATEKNRLIEEALKSEQEAYRLAPSVSTLVNMSITLNKLGKFDNSLELFAKWSGEKNESFYRQQGATYCLKKDISSSISAISESIRLDKSSALRIALDDDFTALRHNNSFTSMIENALPAQLMQAVHASWADDEKKQREVPSP